MSAIEKNGAGRHEPSPADVAAAEIRRLIVRRDAPLLVAFDGRSGSGKSTLARQVAALVESAAIEGDDFYAGGSDADWAARTPEDRAERCIDWRRLRRQAPEPLLAGRPIGGRSISRTAPAWRIVS